MDVMPKSADENMGFATQVYFSDQAKVIWNDAWREGSFS